ncbi:MAG TPA: hypothetical protein VM557_13080 [Thermoanaerobaculia bacterium]|nr:hypothetical protein [Thermoanaerobaculia bacterium]
MTRITARVPLRADLAGGTLDLWPLYLFHPGSRTVHTAISIWAECDVESLADNSIEVVLTDANLRTRYSSLREMAADDRVALLSRAIEHFHLSGVRITTRTEAPRGSGLGGSSALAVALVRALSSFAGNPVEGEDLIELVRDLETRLLGIPAGIQDYYPPVYGGLGALHLDPGKVTRHPINFPLQELADHMVLHYTGVAHFSGTNNWGMYKGHIDGDPRVRDGLAAISKISIEMEKALESRDIRAAAAALDREWTARKTLVDGISNREIDEAITAAKKAGAWGGKVCGAGGGGCIVFLMPPERKARVIAALGKCSGRVLEAGPIGHGIVIEEQRDQAAFAFVRRRGTQGEGEIEQLWVAGTTAGSAAYRPHILAEAAITFDAPRHGVHETLTRTLLAPIDLQTGLPRWADAVTADSDQFDLRVTPDSGRDSINPRDPSAIHAASAEGENLLRQMLAETERLSVFHNAAFGLFSEPGERREDFIRRCLERAERSLENESERLEKTFRRRIDQMRERAEREQREGEGLDDDHQQRKDHEVGIAWGQTLYNITSGRPATTDDVSSRSRVEADYIERIGQLQKSWDRERDALREELTTKARAVEEINLSPSNRSIEIRRYLILWIPRAPVVAS